MESEICMAVLSHSVYVSSNTEYCIWCASALYSTVLHSPDQTDHQECHKNVFDMDERMAYANPYFQENRDFQQSTYWQIVSEAFFLLQSHLVVLIKVMRILFKEFFLAKNLLVLFQINCKDLDHFYSFVFHDSECFLALLDIHTCTSAKQHLVYHIASVL